MKISIHRKNFKTHFLASILPLSPRPPPSKESSPLDGDLPARVDEASRLASERGGLHLRLRGAGARGGRGVEVAEHPAGRGGGRHEQKFVNKYTETIDVKIEIK